jgi:hypothetical protein
MEFCIYLSSTLDDLREERAALMDVLSSAALGVKQSYSASEKDLVSSCWDDVAESAIYLGVIGLRYGYRPEDAVRNPDRKSITHLEFEAARRKSIPCFLFLKSENETLARHTDRFNKENEDGSLVSAFRDTLSSGSLIRTANFSSVQELREKVLSCVGMFQEHIHRRSTPRGYAIHIGEPPRLAFSHVQREAAVTTLVERLFQDEPRAREDERYAPVALWGAGGIGKNNIGPVGVSSSARTRNIPRRSHLDHPRPTTVCPWAPERPHL